jgi:ATP-binding cassette subfamily F protein 3
VILITHDRSLMELVADRLWLAADGTIQPFDGDLEDYARFVLERARAAGRAPTQVKEPEAAPPPPPPTPSRKAPTGNLRRRAEAAEAALARAAQALEAVDAQLTDPKVLGGSTARLAELAHKRAEAHAALEAAEQEWLEAQEAYETVKPA